jgi:8-oxo-dGTP diphosphatase
MAPLFRLPNKILITGKFINIADFSRKLRLALSSGVTLVLLRAKRITKHQYQQLAHITQSLCAEYGAQFLIYGDWHLVDLVGADGLHQPLNGKNLTSNKSPLAADKLLSISIHSVEELQLANDYQPDFVFLSPVNNTETHPDALPLGWTVFSDICEQASMPVYALGGMKDKDIATAIKCGGQGIAGISELWE